MLTSGTSWLWLSMATGFRTRASGGFLERKNLEAIAASCEGHADLLESSSSFLREDWLLSSFLLLDTHALS